MFLALFCVFIVLPVLELYVIVQVASQIGAIETVGLLVLSAVLGVWLCKREGAVVLRRMNAELDRGELPAREMVDGVLILLGGLLLVVPGFITDAVGVLLLIPPIRAGVRTLFLRRMQRRLERAMAEGGNAGFRVVRVTNTGPNGFAPGTRPGPGFAAPRRGSVLDVSSQEISGGSSARDTRTLPPDEPGQPD